MPVASVFLGISLVGMACMVALKLSSLRNGRPGPLAFLSRFDAPLGVLFTRIVVFARRTFTVVWRHAVELWERLHHFIATLMHALIQEVEQRARAWREFTRERKIKRRSASVFIRDVTEYKKELKQNGNRHESHNV